VDVQNEQACTFRLDATPWDNVGEDIINGAGTVDALEDRKRKDARKRLHLARQVLQGCTVVAHPCSPITFGWNSEKARAPTVS